MTLLSAAFLLATIAYLTLAVLIVRNRRSSLNWVCVLILLALAAWSFEDIFHNNLSLAPAQLHYFERFGTPGWTSFASLLLLFILIFTHQRRALRDWFTYPLLAVVPALFSYLQFSGHMVVGYTRHSFGWVAVWSGSAWPIVYYLIYLLLVGFSITLLVRYRRRSASSRERRQALALIITTVVPIVIGTVTDVVLPRFTAVRLPEIAGIIGLVWAGGLYYSATQHGLMSFSPNAAADEILSTMVDALLLLAPDNRVVNFNRSTQELLGYRKSELVGRSAEMLFALPGQFREEAQQVLAGHEIRQKEITALARNGREIPASISARLMRDSSGLAIGSVWVLHDITELRKSEDESRRLTDGLAALNRMAVGLTTAPPGLDIYPYLAEQLRSITGAIAVSTSEYDPDRHEMRIRHLAVEAGLLARINQLLGRSILNLRMPVTPETYDRMVKGTVGSAGQGQPPNFLEGNWGVVPSAIPRPVGAAIQKMLGVETFTGLAFAYRGELLGTAVISSRTGHPLPAADVLRTFANIAAVAIRRKRLEDTLRENEELYHSVVERANDGIVIIQDGIVKYANRRLQEMWGDPETDPVGQEFSSLLDLDERTRIAELYQRRLAGEKVPSTYETIFRRPAGRQVYVEVSAGVISYQGRPADLVILRDTSERRQTAAAVWESEENFRSLAERANDAILISDEQGRHVFANDRASGLTGYSVDELLNIRFRDLVRPEDRSWLEARAAARLQGEKPPSQYEIIVRRKDGQEIPLELSVTRTYWRGDPATLVVARDITERKRIEQELRAERDRAADYLNIAGVIIVALDLNGDITLLNRMGCQLLGYAEGELIGRNWFQTCVPDRVRAATWAGFQSLAAGNAGTAQFFENEVLARAGAELLIAWHNAPLRDAAGRVVGTLSSGTDITAQRQAETARRKSDQRYRTLFEHAPIGIYRTTPDGRILMANPALVRMLGYATFEELAQRNLDAPEPLPPPTPEPHHYDRRQFKAQLEQQGEIRGRETRWPRRDGSLLYVRENALVIRDHAGKTLYYEGTVEDISDRKQAEQEIRQLNAELEQRVQERTAQLEAANRELETFSYSVSHDLRAPLRSLDGFSQALLDDYRDRLDPQGQDYLNRVRAASQRMAQLIDDLLKLSRVTRSELHIESVNLTELAQSVMQEIQQTDPRPPPPGPRPPTVTIAPGLQANGDARLLRVLLTNLLGNAWKFTSHRPHATIEFGQLPSPTGQPSAVFYVRDNGAGFDMAYIEKLFAPFQRLHAAEEFSGSGIGLATAQRIVLRHGGRIWAEGTPDKGASFFFTLGE